MFIISNKIKQKNYILIFLNLQYWQPWSNDIVAHLKISLFASNLSLEKFGNYTFYYHAKSWGVIGVLCWGDATKIEGALEMYEQYPNSCAYVFFL